jgi:hypothetical protein
MFKKRQTTAAVALASCWVLASPAWRTDDTCAVPRQGKSPQEIIAMHTAWCQGHIVRDAVIACMQEYKLPSYWAYRHWPLGSPRRQCFSAGG